MQKARPIPLKLLIISSLLIAMGLVLLLAGIRPLVVLVSVFGLGVLLCLFTQRKPPEGEMPCASVSCCHFLQDNEETEQ